MFSYRIYDHTTFHTGGTATIFFHVGDIRMLGLNGTTIGFVDVEKMRWFRFNGRKLAKARVIQAPGMEETFRPGTDILIFVSKCRPAYILV